MNNLKTLYNEFQGEMLKDFFTFLKFPSISSEAEHKEDILNCAQWLKDYLSDLGFTTELWETTGHPVVFGTHLEAGPEKPTLLIYQHYDVQPVDPLKLWKSPPFVPEIRHGEIYARGAQDNKGQCFYTLQALKLLLKKDGRLPINIKLCIEGEEETGSVGLSKILQEKKKALAADYLAIVDVGIPNRHTPAVTLGVRGIVTMDVEIQGSTFDLHSGSHGGIVYNPTHALVEVLAKLRDSSGRITIPGFYDEVEPLSQDDRERFSFDFNETEYFDMHGCKPTGGEKDFPFQERAWTRPTVEINGISGGYTGKGFKTVIPAKASAKISCRTVPNQNPKKIGELVKKFVEDNIPDGVEVKVTLHEGMGSAIRADVSSHLVKAFLKAYQDVFGLQAKYILEGGSIPIIQELAKASGSKSVILVGLALPDDNMHAPNEHFGIDRLEKGCYIIARAIENLTHTPP